MAEGVPTALKPDLAAAALADFRFHRISARQADAAGWHNPAGQIKDITGTRPLNPYERFLRANTGFARQMEPLWGLLDEVEI
jgi:hypothetical protein